MMEGYQIVSKFDILSPILYAGVRMILCRSDNLRRLLSWQDFTVYVILKTSAHGSRRAGPMRTFPGRVIIAKGKNALCLQRMRS